MLLDRRVAAFLAAAREGSFARAASSLYLSPVAVMNQVNSLEAEVGAPLLARSSRGVALTSAGKLFQARAEAIERQAARAAEEARAAAASGKVLVRVGSSMMRPATFLASVWQRSEALRCRFTLQILPFDDNVFSERWLASVLGCAFDCVTSPYDVRGWYDRFRIIKLAEEPFRVAVPYEHKLAGLPSLRTEDLHGHELVVPPRVSPIVDGMCRSLEKDHPQIRIRELPHLYTSDTFMENAGELVLSRDSFKPMSPGFRTLAVDWGFTTPTGAIFPANCEPGVAEFAEALQAAAGVEAV